MDPTSDHELRARDPAPKPDHGTSPRAALGRGRGAYRDGSRIRVLLADDNAQVLWAPRTVIREEKGVVVIAEASDAEQLLSKARTLRPDVILLE